MLDLMSAGYPRNGKWELVFEDHFDGCELDTSKWTALHRRDSFNDEQQFYLPKNVSIIKEGNRSLLRLTSLKEDFGENGLTRHYTSGLVHSKDKFTFQFGRIEFCARLPRSKGIWPALWAIPNSGKWPPEIDVMEMHGEFPRRIFMTQHWGTRYFHGQTNGKPFEGPDFSADFHIFAAEWEPDMVRWFIDGEERFRHKKHIPNVPFYIIMNTAVGGKKSWGGTADESTEFPQHHDIDYVKVYQKK